MSSEDDQEKQWGDILSGKSYPNRNNDVEQKAHRTRQVILWDAAKTANHITPLEAQQIYEEVYHQHQKRKRNKAIKHTIITVFFLSISYLLFQYYIKYTTQNNLVSSVNIGLLNQSIKSAGVPELMTLRPYMIEVPAGSFQMGCQIGWDDALGGCRRNEKPAHNVTIKKFALAKYETTVGQFKLFVKETRYLTTAEKQSRGCTIQNKDEEWIVSREHNWKKPGFKQTDKHPVVCISWNDAHAYIDWLSKTTAQTYRLPTEEEWEYAARSGKATAFFWGESPNRHFANFRGIEGEDTWEHTAPVGLFGGNWFDLYDMSGNAWEWVEDCWHENYKNECKNQQLRTRRGGGWDNNPLNIRSAYRNKGGKADRSYLYGFRVAHDLKQDELALSIIPRIDK